jgi:type IV pilus assembly protein PilM
VAHRIVGLDIGTSAVRAVELEASEGARPVLLAYGQVGLPPGAVVDGEIRDHSRVVQSIQRLWK